MKFQIQNVRLLGRRFESVLKRERESVWGPFLALFLFEDELFLGDISLGVWLKVLLLHRKDQMIVYCNLGSMFCTSFLSVNKHNLHTTKKKIEFSQEKQEEIKQTSGRFKVLTQLVINTFPFVYVVKITRSNSFQ